MASRRQTFKFFLEGIADLDIKGIKSGVQQAGKYLSQIKVPDDLKESFNSQIKSMLSDVDRFQKKMEKGFHSEKEVQKAYQDYEGIIKQIERFQKEAQKLEKIPNLELISNDAIKRFREAKNAYDQVIKATEDFGKAWLDASRNLSKKERIDIDLDGLKKAADEGKDIAAQIKTKTDEIDVTLNQAYEKLKTDAARRDKLQQRVNNQEKLNIEEFNELRMLRAKASSVGESVPAQERYIASLEKEKIALNKLAESTKIFNLQLKNIQFDGTTKSLKELETIMQELATLHGQELADALAKLAQGANTAEQAARSMQQPMQEWVKTSKEVAATERQMGQLQSRLVQFFSLTNGWNLMRKAMRNAFNVIKDLDQEMTEIAVVTEMTLDQVWARRDMYVNTARELGAATLDVVAASKLYYQQGLSEAEVNTITTETIKMARIAHLDGARATDLMTAAIRGFNLAMSEAGRVNDVYSQLAAKSAADTEEIANAMTKTASIAYSAGATLENTASFLTQMIETTREASENLGTAMKTIIARFQEMKKAPSEIGEIDGELVDANKFETALRTVGIALRDLTTGEFRAFDEVIMEISEKWDSMDQLTQRYIATTAAGSRQQSRFIALVSNHSRLLELTGLAADSAGASQEQFSKTLDSLESKLNQLKNAMDLFWTTLMNSTAIKFIVDFATTVMNTINNITKSLGPLGGSLASIIGTIFLFKGANKLINNTFATLTKAMTGHGVEMGTSLGTGLSKGFSKITSALFRTKDFGKKIFSADILNRELMLASRGFKQLSTEAKKSLAGIGQGLNPVVIGQKRLSQVTDNLTTEQLKMLNVKGDLNYATQEELDILLKLTPQYEHNKNIQKDLTLSWHERFNAANMSNAATKEAGKISDDISKREQENSFKQQASQRGIMGNIIRNIELKKLEAAGVITNTSAIQGEIAANNAAILTSLKKAAATMALQVAIMAAVWAITQLVKWLKSLTLDAKLKAAEASAEALRGALNQAKTAVNDLKQGFDNLKEARDKLDDLTEGTVEWQKALFKVNEEVLELITKFPELAKEIQRGQFGELIVSSEAQERIIKYRQEITLTTQAAALLGEVRVSNLKIQQMEKKIKNVEVVAGLSRRSAQSTSSVPSLGLYRRSQYSNYTSQIIDSQIQDAIKARGGDLTKYLISSKDFKGDTQFSAELESLAREFNVSKQQLYNYIRDLHQLEKDKINLEDQTRGAIKAILISSMDNINVDKEYQESLINLLTESFSKRYETDIEKYKKALLGSDEDRKSFAAGELDISFIGGGTKVAQLQEIYSKIFEIPIDSINKDIKDNKEALAAAIADAYFSDALRDNMAKWAERFQKIVGTAAEKRQVKGILSEDFSKFMLSDFTEQLDKEVLANIAKSLGFEDLKTMLKELGYEGEDAVEHFIQNNTKQAAKARNAFYKELRNFYSQNEIEKVVAGFTSGEMEVLNVHLSKMSKKGQEEAAKYLMSHMTELKKSLKPEAFTDVINRFNTMDLSNRIELEEYSTFLEELGLGWSSDRINTIINDMINLNDAFYQFSLDELVDKAQDINKLIQELKKGDKDTFSTEEFEKYFAHSPLADQFRQDLEGNYIYLGGTIERLIKTLEDQMILERTDSMGLMQEKAKTGKILAEVEFNLPEAIKVEYEGAIYDDIGEQKKYLEGIFNKLIDQDIDVEKLFGITPEGVRILSQAQLDEIVKQLEIFKENYEDYFDELEDKAAAMTFADLQNLNPFEIINEAVNEMDPEKLTIFTDALLMQARVYEETAKEADTLRKAQKEGNKEAIKAAQVTLAQKIHFQAVAEKVKKHKEEIEKTTKALKNYKKEDPIELLKNLKFIFNEILDLNISDEFLTDAENYDLLKRVLEGSDQAWQDLLDYLWHVEESSNKSGLSIEELARKFGFTEEQILNIVANLDGQEFTINGKADVTQLVNELLTVGNTAAEVIALMEGLSKAKFVSKQIPIYGGEIVGTKTPGGRKIIYQQEIVGYRTVYELVYDKANVPAINPIRGTYTSDTTGGGSGKGVDERWNNPYDWTIDMLSKIEASLRQINMLEQEYNRLQRDSNTSTRQLVELLEKKKNLLKTTAEDQRVFEEMAENALREYMAKHPEFLKYAHYDFNEGRIKYDTGLLEGLGDSPKGKEVQEFIDGLKQGESTLHSAQDALLGTIDALDELTFLIEDILDLGGKYWDWERNVDLGQVYLKDELDELKYQQERMIDLGLDATEDYAANLDRQWNILIELRDINYSKALMYDEMIDLALEEAGEFAEFIERNAITGQLTLINLDLLNQQSDQFKKDLQIIFDKLVEYDIARLDSLRESRQYEREYETSTRDERRRQQQRDKQEKTEKLWINTIDWLYNILKHVNKELRHISKIQWYRDKKLKAGATTAEDIKNTVLLEVGSNLRLIENYSVQEKALYTQLEAMNSEYADLSQYLKYNYDTNSLLIDWAQISNNTNEETGKKIEKAIKEYEEVEKRLENIDDSMMKVVDNLDLLLKYGRQDYMALEKRVYAAIEGRYQQEINYLSEINESILTSNSKLLAGIRKAIDQARQNRELDKTLEDISKKERKLALLQQDRSGANALEILALEEELADARQDYTDQLIDKAIEELEEINDIAEEQREQQIKLLEQQLKSSKETGELWAEVKSMLGHAFDTGNYDTIWQVLKDYEEIRALSDNEKEDWEELLNSQIVNAQVYSDIRDALNGQGDPTIVSAIQAARLASEGYMAIVGAKLGQQDTALTNQAGYISSMQGSINSLYASISQLLNSLSQSSEEGDSTPVGGDLIPSPTDLKPPRDSEPEPKKEPEPTKDQSKPKEEPKPTTPATPSVKVVTGEKVRVSPNAKIFVASTTPEAQGVSQYFKNDPRYVIERVLESTGRVLVRHISTAPGSATGWFNIKDLLPYKKGGLVDFTGPAMLHGSRKEPEGILNSKDTKNFIQLRDILEDILTGKKTIGTGSKGDNYYSFDIQVDQLANDYDVDKVITKVKRAISEDARYRNVNVLHFKQR